MKITVQYSGISEMISMNAPRADISSLKMSRSVTVTSVCCAIMGMASTASCSVCIESPLPPRRW